MRPPTSPPWAPIAIPMAAAGASLSAANLAAVVEAAAVDAAIADAAAARGSTPWMDLRLGAPASRHCVADQTLRAFFLPPLLAQLPCLVDTNMARGQRKTAALIHCASGTTAEIGHAKGVAGGGVSKE